MIFVYPNKPIRIYNIPKLLENLPLDKWVCQPKWDGKRVLPQCNGTVVLFGRQGQRFSEKGWDWLCELPLPQPWSLDGELLRDGRMIVWDYSIMAGKNECRLPYQIRWGFLSEHLANLNFKDKKFSLVESRPANEYKNVLAPGKKDGLEGCVFKYSGATNLWGIHSTSEVNSQFKYRF